MHLKQILLYVKNLADMAAFYETSLGLKPIAETRTETWVEFDAGSTCIALHKIPETIASQIQLSSPPEPRKNNPVKLIFEVADLAHETKRLASLGVTLHQQPWGAWDGIDPEGNIFQLVQTP
jgi:catechol-2,3-dioxygenase